MHYVISPFGSAGDVHPMLGLALALQQRGHEITVLVNGYFKPLTEQLGLPCHELGTKEEFVAALENPELWESTKAFRHIARTMIAPTMRKQYEFLAERSRRERIVTISNVFGFGALIAQDKLNIPLVSIHLQPSMFWSDIEPPAFGGIAGPRWVHRIMYRLGVRFFIDPVLLSTVNPFRAELGLPPVKSVPQWWHSRGCIIGMFPQWFCPPQADWPTNVIQTDFPLWDERHDEPLPAEVEQFLAAATPPIVFTPGSANMFGAKFFAAAAEACRRLGRRGILLTRFPEQIPANLPTDVRHFSYVPFGPLLPRAAALVHHGGIGSTAQAIAAGIGQLIMPLAHDQFDNAARVKKLDLGDSLKVSRFTARRVEATLSELLSSARVAQACRTYASKLAGKDGCEQSAAAIEEWSDRNVPLAV